LTQNRQQEKEFMATDWKLLHRLVNSALDACEALDQLEITDDERSTAVRAANGQTAGTVWDALQSAHIFPENVRYMVIRGREQLGDSAPFVQPVSRVLQQTGLLAAELVGSQQLQVPIKGIDPYSPEREQSLESVIESLAAWYESHLVPNLESALANARGGEQSS
jgi:hypothetical protein